MGSSSKKSKDKESRKRRHEARGGSPSQEFEMVKEKRHKHKKHHHKEKKRDRSSRHEQSYDASPDVEIIEDLPPPPPPLEECRVPVHHHGEYRDSLQEYKESREYSREIPPAKERRVVREVPPVKEHREVRVVREKSPEPSNQSHESLSIEETNRLRAKLGLKPLEVGGSSSAKPKEDGKIKDDLGEFYHKPAVNLVEKAKQEKIRAKITEHKEKRKFMDKYSRVKGLGESDEDEDAASWIDKNRKIVLAKKEAEKRAKMLEELDAQFGIGEVIESEQREKRQQQYTNRDLRGLRVDHDVTTFADERTVVLTLKDKGVLDEDDNDVLVNVNMLDDERYKKNVENKKKKIQYNAYEDTEYDEFGNLREKTLLSKYDEEIDGEKSDGFRIGNDRSIERKFQVAQSIKEKLATKRLESIAETNLVIASDYYNEQELSKFKKPKKKVRKIRSKGKLLTADELEKSVKTGIEKIGSRRPKSEDAHLDIDDIPAFDIKPSDIKFEDDKDDVLEKALHRARQMKQKENIISDRIASTEVKEEPEDEKVDPGSIVLNATAEFCRTLGDIPTYGKAGNRDETEEIDEMEFENNAVNDELSDDDDCQVIEPTTGWNSVDTRTAGQAASIAPQEVQILDEEPDVSTGVGAALKLAMSKGYLDKEDSNRPSNSRLAHLQAQHYSIEDKAYGDDERGGRRERYSGPIQDFREREGFKPNVKLEYIDDDGHILNSKEAFRYLSHKFHGKGPGKNKIEKRLKKNVQEQLMKKMSSTDTPLGTLNMLQQKQKETQSAFVVLSGSKQGQSTIISKARR